jgi:predicted metal-dependent peptidase
VYYTVREDGRCPPDGWLVVHSDGYMHVHPTRVAEPEHWAYVIAHACLHLGFGHFVEVTNPRAWALACDMHIAKFLQELKFGTPPDELRNKLELFGQTEERIYRRLCNDGLPQTNEVFGTAGKHAIDFLPAPKTHGYSCERDVDWQAKFSYGLEDALRNAVNVAAGYQPTLISEETKLSNAKRARRWLIDSYPLLGAMASAFKLIEDRNVCSRMDISVAAVDAELKEIYVNPTPYFSENQMRFVMAHEFLHVSLQHHLRCNGRDKYLFNVACDYVINGWLVEMGVGEMPNCALYDPEFKGLSAEAVYNELVVNIRKNSRLATLRGSCGHGDIMGRHEPDWWSNDGLPLDEFYRRCLAQGLEYHEASGRGYLPASLIEEIRAIVQPPIPWDVELARWFDHYFPPLEKRRSYARQSRRQASTPDIPRPRYAAGEPDDARTFGVVLDTSGSMDRQLLAKALGAIASYSISREVPFARVVFCDAAAHDEGYMAPEAIAHKVKVKGRGGTVLQPGVDLLERAKDFPSKGPLLIITDGMCDHVRVRRPHAFLIPEGRYLPFKPTGEVFRIAGNRT